MRALAAIALVVSVTLPSFAGNISRVNVDTSGDDANEAGFNPSASDGARFVAFDSSATDLVMGDTNDANDVFVRDRETSETELVSVSSSGEQGNRRSIMPSISADGRFVSFLSVARNLVPSDGNDLQDAFVHDRVTGETIRASVDSFGVESNGETQDVVISADGRFVAFSCTASNLHPLVERSQTHVYVHDLVTRITSLASVDSSGRPGSGASQNPSISADGRFVAFDSQADDLVPGDFANRVDIFVRDRQHGITTRVSVSSMGEEADDDSDNPQISANGRTVAFFTSARNLYFHDVGGRDVVVRDAETGEIRPASVDATGQHAEGISDFSLSPSGRSVALSQSQRLFGLPVDTDGTTDVYLVCLDARNAILVSRGLDSRAGLGSCGDARFATDGSAIVFEASEPNLVPFDFNSVTDVFLYEPSAVALDSVTPSSASETGGDVLTLHGSGFPASADELSVTVGGEFAAVLETSPTFVTIAVPAGTGRADVAIATADGCLTLEDGVEYVDPEIVARRGNVGARAGEPQDVLTVNGSAGENDEREVRAALREAILVEMATPAGTPSARYSVYAWPRDPNATTLTVQPFDLGTTVFPTPLSGFSPQPNFVWNNLGFTRYFGEPDFPSSPAPSVVANRPEGRANPVTVAFQGFIIDRDSATSRHVSVTNAVILRVN